MATDRTNVAAIPESKRPRIEQQRHPVELCETTEELDRLELFCILCHERLPPKARVMYFHTVGAIAHATCYAEVIS